MRYLALACDYDGTLASDGAVDGATLDALQRVKDSGRRLVLVTGRVLEDLLTLFPAVTIFDKVVAENGAVVYTPASRQERLIGEAPPARFTEELARRGVSPLAVGRVIVATWEPNQVAVVEAIREMALELQVIFNKGAVMVLPSGVNKAVGLAAALEDMRLSPHNVVGIGDAENDHAFLASVEASFAVANALPMLKERADMVTSGSRGQGVTELCGLLLANDLRDLERRLARHGIRIGESVDRLPVHVHAHGGAVLLAGPSEAGKSTLATTFLERLAEAGRQFCIIDPEGDYASIEAAVSLGTRDRLPTHEEVMEVLARPGRSVSVNLIGVRADERPPFFESLLARLLDLRASTGRPHWLIVDEAHHVLPRQFRTEAAFGSGLENAFLVTLRPQSIAPHILASVGAVLAVGDAADETFSSFYAATAAAPPPLTRLDLPRGEAALLRIGPGAGSAAIVRFRVDVPRSEQRRHRRKYAEGQLAPEFSFYFRGPTGKLRLRAPNLNLFLHLADGVDDETWLHHLRAHDYSRWFRDSIKDEALAEATEAIEDAVPLAPAESRQRIREAIEERYTLPVYDEERPQSA